MKPLRIPGDPARAAKDHLAATIPALISGIDPTFGLSLPGDWTPASAPWVVVFDDTGPAVWPIATRPLLRITVWSSGRTRSREIAGLCLGVLLAHQIPGIATARDPSSILDARDSHNNGIMASFTVRATARTIAA
ncbi:hypothetical protein [Rhodococcus jostii]|uniref:hypothetical protein n=1 Tax=Rhodococcus jostii TaxID=132919 RepID=UPI003633D77C